MKTENAYGIEGRFIYTVTCGDTVSGIAEKFGMPLFGLVQLNALKEEPPAGSKLLIERKGEKFYTVKAGDTLESILAKFSLNKSDFIENNVCHNIYPGLKIYI